MIEESRNYAGLGTFIDRKLEFESLQGHHPQRGDPDRPAADRAKVTLHYSVFTSAGLAAVLGFLQVAVVMTPENSSLFTSYALMFSVVMAPFGAVSGTLAALSVLIVAGRGASRRSRAFVVAVALAFGSLPGLAFAVWLTGQFALDVRYPTPLHWVEFSVALVVLCVGGARLSWKADTRVLQPGTQRDASVTSAT